MTRSVFNHRRLTQGGVLLSADSFNRSAANLNGTSTDGSGSLDPLTWTSNGGIITGGSPAFVVQDAGPDTSDLGRHTAYVDLTTADCDLRLDVATSNTASYAGGILFRYTSTTNYWMALWCFDSVLRLYKTVSGTETLVSTSGSVGGVSGTIRVVLNGSSIGVYKNTTDVSPTISTTDSALSTATKHGLAFRNDPTSTLNATTLNNWAAYSL